MTFSKWTLGAAALFALASFAAPAVAQTQSAAGEMGSGSGMGINLGGGDKQVDESTIQRRREIEQAYKNATHNAPAQTTAVNDPWSNMRGAEEAKPAVKPTPKTAQKKKPAQ